MPTFISKIYTKSKRLKVWNSFICWCFSFYEQLKFRTQLSWEWTKINHIGPGLRFLVTFTCFRFMIQPTQLQRHAAILTSTKSYLIVEWMTKVLIKLHKLVSVFTIARIKSRVSSDEAYMWQENTSIKVRKRAKIRNRYNQAPRLTQDTNGKVTTSQLDNTNESQEVSPFPAGDYKASTNRRAWKHNKQDRIT